jgi:hypothetical protein
VVQVLPDATRQIFLVSAQPNPFRDRINIRLNFDKQIKLDVRLTDINGVLVRRTVLMAPVGSSSQTLGDLAELKSGVYILELTGGNEKFRQRIIKL